MSKIRMRVPNPLLAALACVGLTLGCLFAGYEPLGGDPDCLYRPIKTELAASLRMGSLPFWSDHFGLGTPLVAESHAAAFYPPNWLLYRFLDVSTAYRLSMWAHYLATALATYGYARVLGISPWGSSLASVSFSLCGFQASHSCHEPFYHALPFMPLTLMLAERYMAVGGLGRLALLALLLGAQITLGHFQIQMWTLGLVVLTGVWRSWGQKLPWRRAVAIAVTVGWGLAVAAVQLGLTWDLVRASNFARPVEFMMPYAFPPGHWAQLALPRLFMSVEEGGATNYWTRHQTTTNEACLYVGTIPLILAFVGLIDRRDRMLGLWRWVAVVGFILATMPHWFSDGYWLILQLPGLGHFRAPGRYLLLTSLGLSLLAGRGFDRAIPLRTFWVGFGFASLFGIGAIVWGSSWSSSPEIRSALVEEERVVLLVEAALLWLASLVVVASWRAGRIGFWIPFLLASCELAYLFHQGTTPWGWSIRLPGDSPVLQVLRTEAAVGLIAGPLQDIPVRVGLTTAYANNLGITPPPPNYLLERSGTPDRVKSVDIRWMHRLGVTHGVYEESRLPFHSLEVYLGEDPVLERLVPRKEKSPKPRRWRVVRFAPGSPHVRAARVVHIAQDWGELYSRLSMSESPDEVWFLKADLMPDPPGPRAGSVRVLEWDGQSGAIEHDGTCDLVIRRTYMPGWFARLDGGPPIPVTPADGGLQSVRIPGSGITRVTVNYIPVMLRRGLVLSLAAVALALIVLATDSIRWFRARMPNA